MDLKIEKLSTCEFCSKRFRLKMNIQRFCSVKCGEQARKLGTSLDTRHKVVGQELVWIRTCKKCKTDFESKIGVAKYCKECKKDLYTDKSKDKSKEIYIKPLDMRVPHSILGLVMQGGAW